MTFRKSKTLDLQCCDRLTCGTYTESQNMSLYVLYANVFQVALICI